MEREPISCELRQRRRECLKFDEALQEIYFGWSVANMKILRMLSWLTCCHDWHSEMLSASLCMCLKFKPEFECPESPEQSESKKVPTNPLAHTPPNQKVIPFFSHSSKRMCVCVMWVFQLCVWKTNFKKSSYATNLQVPTTLRCEF